MGRKKGTLKSGLKKTTGKGVAYPPVAIMIARDMFIQGERYEDISQKINDTIGRKPSIPLISKWAKEYDWQNAKIEAIGRAVLANDNQNLGVISKDINEQVTAYKQVLVMGLQELVKQGASSRSMEGASEMIDRAIKGLRAIDSGVVQFKFLEMVFRVLKEEIGDPSVLSKVAIRLKSYVAEQMGISAQ